MPRSVLALCKLDDGSSAALTAEQFMRWGHRVVSFHFIEI